MSLKPCTDLQAATSWLIKEATPWGKGISPAPRGFSTHARVRFIPDPDYSGQSSIDAHLPDRERSDKETIAVILSVLRNYTRTADTCFYALWDGWGTDGIDQDVPKMHLPDRDYWVLYGSISEFAFWNSLDAAAWPFGSAPDPAFIWPADRAWTITYDIDDHYAIVSASEDAVGRVLATTELDSVRITPGEEVPYWD